MGLIHAMWSNGPLPNYLSTLHDRFQKYLSGVYTLEAACEDVRTLLYNNDLVLFPSGHTGCSVSALTTQILYPVHKVPQLHLKCSHCNQTVMLDSNRIGRLMHVAHSAAGSISQILENHMCHHSFFSLFCVIKPKDSFCCAKDWPSSSKWELDSAGIFRLTIAPSPHKSLQQSQELHHMHNSHYKNPHSIGKSLSFSTGPCCTHWHYAEPPSVSASRPTLHDM